MRKIQLGACLADQKKFKDAEPMLVESYAIIKKEFGIQGKETRAAGSRLIELYEGQGRKDKAAGIRADLEMTD